MIKDDHILSAVPLLAFSVSFKVTGYLRGCPSQKAVLKATTINYILICSSRKESASQKPKTTDVSLSEFNGYGIRP